MGVQLELIIKSIYPTLIREIKFNFRAGLNVRENQDTEKRKRKEE